MELSSLSVWIQSTAAKVADTRPLMAAVAKSMQVVYKNHFQKREGEGNKKGFPSRHFWAREVSRQMTTESSNFHASVLISSPAYVHKIFGGCILPKRGKALAIPMSAAAYAAGSPRISGLPLIFIPDINRKVIGWLVEHEMNRVKGGRLANAKTLGTIHYLLVPHVDQPADPDAQPPVENVENSVKADVSEWMQRTLK